MFESLSDRLGGILDKLKTRKLTEGQIDEAMREVRVALLEADVALPVVKDFIAKVKQEAVGQEVVKSVSAGQMVIKIVHDALVEMLGSANEDVNLAAAAPVPILMVGLQGSGKTTTSAKIARHLTTKRGKKVLLASLDIYRPAAQEQLAQLAGQIGVVSLPIVAGDKPAKIAQRAMKMARTEGFDVVILDTAGRLHIDQELMAEVAEVRDICKPAETLLVVDAMTGQDAVTLAKEFNEKVGVTGIVLTRIDGDARGGAALSMRAVTGCPIKLLGVGEKVDALEPFHPDRLAGRILGMGDVVSLVEKAAEVVDAEKAAKMARKMVKGEYDFEDLLDQLRQVKKMGDMKGLLGMIPGLGKVAQQMAASKLDAKLLNRQEAIILSMTIKERRQPVLIKASRKERIAQGAGVSVSEVNKLLKQLQQMSQMMKKMGQMQKKGLFGGGPDMSELMAAAQSGGAAMPDLSALGSPGGPKLPGLGGPLRGLPPGFPGKK
ncbi:MAG: signal recognition particle protein [Alphaproteobacteria bacterium RIFOXYD12_FULL_60_8]|nr:MAG: signal recognition particle protein [Alphaproteobacteria bacterium RIFOXYD12_FULL_60_8]